MGRIGKETAGQIISFIGLVGVAVTCGIPMWRVTSFIGANIVTGQIVWDGLWMNCVMQSTGQMQCRLNESVMRLTPDLQAARALVIISLVFGFIGFMITFIGAKCTSCLQKDASKAKVVIIGGCLLILAAVLVLIPVTWSATITITDFQNPSTIDTQRREIGAAIYIGWGSAAILLVGGIILTTSCPPQRPLYGYPGYQPAPVYPYTNGSTYAPAARALVVIAIIVAAFGIILGIAGGKCTNFVEDRVAKAKVAVAAGVIFICAGVLVLIPVCWSANTIIRDFYNPILTNAQRRELGAALYIGWGTSALLLLGGALLCSSCPPKESPEYPVKYSGARSTATSRAYV
ncbi:claudin-4-like isoform X3 [Dunckerocampus dactyliophorus]|uniref:claudin-4-like isoform X3 n=1 Tax=Dunckerocampus dactyliophorus TaxID=161453 RepID=UPI002406794E|nr:claudin-4-like isoform X3 [Dunckerocampus dactyliophorus]